MTETEDAASVPTRENSAIWESKNWELMKMMISAQGLGQLQMVVYGHSTDIELGKSAQPAEVELQPRTWPPWKT